MISVNLPIGIEDYSIANSKYYVDKTLIIKDIIDKYEGNSILITKPRRFGKSLMLSMLDYYFSLNVKDNHLFDDKLIAKENSKYLEEMNNHPVIHLNMKNLYSNSADALLEQVIEIISNIYSNYYYLLDSDKLIDLEKEKYQEILNKNLTDKFLYVQAIYFLSKLLYKHHGKKVVILIDEYDTPLEDAYQKGFYNDVIYFFKKMYSSCLKANEYMYFSMITGVLEIAKESIFSDLNNLCVCSVVDEELSQYFGFTSLEIEKMIQDFEIEYSIDKIEEWYGGYGTKDVHIFNPWSIINFMYKRKFFAYWVNSGSKDTVEKIISDIPNALNILNEFVNNKYLTFTFNNSISYKDIKNDTSTLFSYLVQSGYLVARSTDEYNNYNLTIPNLEIKNVFENEIIDRNRIITNYSIINSLKDAIIEKKVDEISYILKDFIINSFSYYDLTLEKDYKTMLVTLFSVLFTSHIVKSEVNSKNGRCDIMILPKNDKNLGLVIELKKYKGRIAKDRLSSYSKQALEQIKENNYYDELERLRINKILMYGFAFDDKNNSISFDEIDS